LFSVKRSIAEAAVISEGNFAIQVVHQQKQYVAKLTNQERYCFSQYLLIFFIKKYFNHRMAALCH
jgi:hypothetical protein